MDLRIITKEPVENLFSLEIGDNFLNLYKVKTRGSVKGYLLSHPQFERLDALSFISGTYTVIAKVNGARPLSRFKNTLIHVAEYFKTHSIDLFSLSQEKWTLIENYCRTRKDNFSYMTLISILGYKEI